MANKVTANWEDERTIICYITDNDYVEIQYHTNFNWQASQRVQGDFLKDYIEPLVEKGLEFGGDNLWGVVYNSHFRNRWETPKRVVRNPQFPEVTGFGFPEDYERIALGKEIKKLCVERGIGQKQLAEMIEMSPGNLSRILQGKISVGYDILCKIAYALGKKVVLVDLDDGIVK